MAEATIDTKGTKPAPAPPATGTKAPAEEPAKKEPDIVDRFLGTIAKSLDGVGLTVTLTGQTVAWLVRPPFRFAQLTRAMEYFGVQSRRPMRTM